MEQTQLLRSLRSVRRFGHQPIPSPVLDDILDVARWTGSAKNTQPWEIVVIRQHADLQALADCGAFAAHLAGATVGLALVMESPRELFDEGRLAQNLMLAAWAHGVGSCIASIYPAENSQRARERLEIPADRGLNTVLSLGYPADERARRVSAEIAAGHRGATIPLGRKPPAEMVSWDRYGQRQPG